MKDTRRLELKDALNLTVMMFEELEHLEEEHDVVGPIRIIIDICYIYACTTWIIWSTTISSRDGYSDIFRVL